MAEMNIWKRHELASASAVIDWTLYDERTPLSFHEAQPALMASYGALWTVGTLGNLWVAFVVGYLLLRSRSHRAGDAPLSVQVYVFSLCLFDLLGLLFLPLLLLDLIFGSWTIPSPFLCKVYLLSEGFNKFGSPWLLTALSAFCCSNIRTITQISYCNASCKYGSERNDSVGSVMISQWRLSSSSKTNGSFNASCSLRRDNGRRAAVTVILFTLAVILAMSPVLIYSDIYYITSVIRNDTELHVLASKCAFQPPHSVLTIFTVYSFILGYLCPAFLFTYYYGIILYCVRKRKGRFAFGSSLRRQARDRYCRVARTAIGLVSWTLVGWTPFWMIFLYFYFHPQTDAEDMASSSSTIVLSYFVHMLPYITCSGYPILYTLLNKNLRNAYTREKMASANKKKRKRFASMGTECRPTTTRNSYSSGSTGINLRSSVDCSDVATHNGDETVRLKPNAF